MLSSRPVPPRVFRKPLPNGFHLRLIERLEEISSRWINRDAVHVDDSGVFGAEKAYGDDCAKRLRTVRLRAQPRRFSKSDFISYLLSNGSIVF
jgi:hypothetical protein